MPGVDTNVPLLVPVAVGHEVTVNNGASQTILYQDAHKNTISQSVFDGSIPPFGTLSFVQPQVLLSAAPGGLVHVGYDL